MLLVDEHRVDWIDSSWIDEALAKEPAYLQPIITNALTHGALKKNDDAMHEAVPLPVIFNMFTGQLINRRQKTAIYDPVLVRLQSLKDETQEEVFKAIGLGSIAALQHHCAPARLTRFLSERGMKATLPLLDLSPATPFANKHLRSLFLRELARYRPAATLCCAQYAGLLTTALYLLPLKQPWQRSITLGLNHQIGISGRSHHQATCPQ